MCLHIFFLQRESTYKLYNGYSKVLTEKAGATKAAPEANHFVQPASDEVDHYFPTKDIYLLEVGKKKH